MTTKQIIEVLESEVNKAELDEKRMNQNLGYADDFLKGSLSISLRWDIAAEIVELLKRIDR